MRRRDEFNVVWKSRFERDVTPEVVAFLHDQDASSHERAVCALGRLATREAETALLDFGRGYNEWSLGTPLSSVNGVNGLTYRMALARAQSRDMHGAARVSAVAESIGLSLDDLIRISERTVRFRGPSEDVPGTLIMDEVVDLLYTMAKGGENVAALSAAFHLTPPQRVMVQSGALSDKAEVDYVIRYLASRPSYDAIDDRALARNHLVGLGERARVRLQAFLAVVCHNPSHYVPPGSRAMRPDASQLALPLIAIMATHDQRFVPLLTTLAHSKDAKMSEIAEFAITRLQESNPPLVTELP